MLTLLALLPLAASQLLGGYMNVDVNRDDVQKMATFALGELNKLSNTQSSQVKVVAAKTQVVSGVNYMLTLQLGDTTCDVTIWSRAWMHDTRMTKHTCHSNTKRQLTGGPLVVSTDRDDVKEMASFALSELNQLTGTKNSLVQIVFAKTQVVSGTNYLLSLKIGHGHNAQLCNVTIWYRPWLHSKKMTNHVCNSSSKRQNLMPGGMVPVDVHSADIQKMATFALGEINGLEGAQNSLVEVVSATEQVVAGMSYRLTLKLKSGAQTRLCTVRIWSQPWMNRLSLSEHKCSSTSKRSVMVGGTQTVSTDDKTVQDMAAFALSEINGVQGTQNSLVKVLSAKTQVVAGVDYILKLSLNNGGKTQICDVEIWYKAWENSKMLISQHCTAGSKRALLGAVQPGTLDKRVQGAIEFAEDSLNAKANSMFRMVTETVDHVTQQIVAGVKYTFDLNLVSSTCRNNDDNTGKTLQDCPASTGAMLQHQTCHVKVLYQMWKTPKYTLLSDSCDQFS